ncbi:polysaccharide lyase 8 family protein [Pseudonocardia acaciae]|uniref:polysaccharide lyase 8 family protein n=1 Tax=Pseudonocardia acaciae TaxID=551276 RepID=UPI0009FBFA41|nr:polysaccharide lyase 8 family protein [Pseudonocardia acaciae]
MMFNRRAVLRYGSLAALVGVAFPACAPSPAGAPAPLPGKADLDRIVAAYRELQIGTHRDSPARAGALAALDQVALAYDAAMKPTDGSLWPDLPFGPGSTHFPMMYYRLRTMAVDWATPGSALSRRPDLPERLLAALDSLYRHQYNENTQEIGNWYVYEIGVPYWLLQTVVALGEKLPPADRERLLRPVLRFVADPNRRVSGGGKVVETGANRADKALITVVSGALAGDPARVATGVAAVTDTAGAGAASLVTRVTEGDGFRTDGSFIQHDTVPYSGHYGLVLLSAAAGLAHVTAGTAVELAPDVRQAFYDAVTDVFAPFLVGGSMMEPVRGRMLSRQGETGHDAGHQFIAAAALLALSAPEPARSRLAERVTPWVGEPSWAPYSKVDDLARYSGGLQPVGVPEVEQAERLVAGRPQGTAGESEHRAFPQMDRMAHHTAGWSASLGLSSTRTCRYEAINGQNLRGWFVGDGVLYLFLPGEQQGHYSDAYWPTVDATALPGTTEKVAPPPPLVGNPPPAAARPFAGGVRFDDGHGAYGLDFASQDGTLSAKKSWFFTPDAVLCLGAGITDLSGAPVRTIVENRNLGEGGTAALLVDGRPAPAQPGRAAALPGARWLHLAGVAGYLLLDQPGVTVLREDRTGSWLDVDTGANTHGTSTRYTRRYQQIRLEHGARPAGASYAYAVLPGASAEQTAAAAGRWTVLANTAQAQAVRLERDVLAAVFHAPGRAGEVAVSGACTVAWGRTGDDWTLAVADPARTLDTVHVTIDKPGLRVVRADPGVTVAGPDPRLELDVKLAGSLGATRTVTLR